MRSIWKGAISFGLVTIPVKLYSATEEKDVSFHQVRRSDGSRVKYKRVAAADGAEVEYGDIAKGFELPTGETVILTDEDLAGLPLSTSRAIDVLQFVPLEQVDPIYFAKSYYLEPDKAGVKPYVLLRDALEQSGKVAVVKIALRQRESLATLRVRAGVFVLETMLWPDEIRRPSFDFLDAPVEVRPQEMAMAGSLIETLAADFDPTQFSDAYRDALQAVIDAKIEGRDVVGAPPEAPGGGAVLDLMAALRASVEAARGAGAGAAATGPAADAAAADGDGEPGATQTGAAQTGAVQTGAVQTGAAPTGVTTVAARTTARSKKPAGTSPAGARATRAAAGEDDGGTSQSATAPAGKPPALKAARRAPATGKSTAKDPDAPSAATSAASKPAAPRRTRKSA